MPSTCRAPIPSSSRRSRRPSGASRPPCASRAGTARRRPSDPWSKRGSRETHFGAGTWDRGGGKAISLVTFEAAGLTADALYESYLAGAVGNTKIHDLETSTPTLGGSPGHRLAFLNGDSSFQRILVWPGDRPGQVKVILAADLVDSDIQAAVDAFR